MTPKRLISLLFAALSLLAAKAFWASLNASGIASGKMTAAIQYRLNEMGLQSLGIIRLNDGDFVVALLLLQFYGLCLGALVHLIMGPRAFGWKLNALVTELGIVAAIVGYALINPYPDASALPYILFFGALTASVVMIVLALVKHWLTDAADGFMSGVYSTGTRSVSKRASRIDAVARTARRHS